MAISNASGEILNNAVPLVTAYVSANVAIANGATVIFNTKILDVGTNYNASTGVFTAPTTGKYLIMVTTACNFTTGGSYALEINDVTPNILYPVSGGGPASFTNASPMSANGGIILALASGSTMKVTMNSAGMTGLTLLGLSGSVFFCWLSVLQVM